MSRKKNRTEDFMKRCDSFPPSATTSTSLRVKANALGFIDAPMLKAEALRWHKFQADIEAVFLRPR